MFTILAGLLLLDDKATFRNSGFHTIANDNELFKNLVFLAVLIANTLFLSVWAYTFIGVQVRIHFSTIKKVLAFLNISFGKEMQDYETNLSSYLKREQATVQVKSHSKMRDSEKGLQNDDDSFKSSFSK